MGSIFQLFSRRTTKIIKHSFDFYTKSLRPKFAAGFFTFYQEKGDDYLPHLTSCPTVESPSVTYTVTTCTDLLPDRSVAVSVRVCVPS